MDNIIPGNSNWQYEGQISSPFFISSLPFYFFIVPLNV